MTKSKLLAAALGLLVLAGAAAPVSARQPAPAPAVATTITAAQRAAVIDAVRAKVNQLYVFPEKRAAIIARLDAGQKAGRYDLASPVEFAGALTRDLAESSGDGHMYINYDPAQAEAAAARRPDEEDAFWHARALRENHGLGEMKILPGNIRYLKITGFLWAADLSGQAYDDAMRFLKGGDAIVIDLRGNGGGDAAAVNYLTSHFLKPDTLLLTFHRGSETPSQSRTLASLPAGRLTGKPLYVLTDRGCFSACEEFAYHVQQFKLGELIGATTGGGANNNDLIPVGSGFVVSISAGRPVHAISGTNWEGVGIKPAIDVAPGQALDVALERALTRLAAAPAAPAASRIEYAWALAEVEARLRPVTLSPERLQALAGPYGSATVTLRDGALWLARPERPERRLSPMDDKGLFGVDGSATLRVRFTAAGLELLRPDGSEPVRFPRR